MELKNIRFEEIGRDSFYVSVLQNAHNINLKKILLSKDADLIETVLSFFQRNKDNGERLRNELVRMDEELELRRIIYGDDSEAYLQMVKLKRTLRLIYQFNYKEFKRFRSNFVEYVAFVYFSIVAPFVKNKLNRKRRFFHEPQIYYRASKNLGKSISANAQENEKIIIGNSDNLVDLIHVNKDECAIDICECKADLNHFLLHLKNRSSNDPDCKKSLKKWVYMNNVQNFFNENVAGCSAKLYFFTFADTINNAEQVNDEAIIITSAKICSAFCI
ncbi:hypothetical protein [Enterococcus pallens]|uniref:Uncharacterized protein n=1 Tax=Enterococcus pallens ATCC BAA-351 TaxID=1158607 RepID=R2SES0_9ENTE|nr:hypothetical protein [Enterococcus pallens]EOH86679.1 hypothetical protein UAU_05124 [Enterococcus pallens ATCC BAA-351]EOU18475.1 hypothetical protein I588_03469 [Enterococcus pallens ATCC BAA-351]OJG81215.1 hypothetical protein RV10_GL003343 [Enterococcus pallens]